MPMDPVKQGQNQFNLVPDTGTTCVKAVGNHCPPFWSHILGNILDLVDLNGIIVNGFFGPACGHHLTTRIAQRSFAPQQLVDRRGSRTPNNLQNPRA